MPLWLIMEPQTTRVPVAPSEDAGRTITLLEKLRLCPFLAQLPTEDVYTLAASASVERLASRFVLFRQGDAADRLYVVAAGHVALYLGDPDDTARIASILGPGDTIGEASVCGCATYPVSAQLFGPGELISIPGSVFCSCLTARPEAVLGMLSEMSLRLRRLLRQITDLKMKTATQRLGVYLAGLTLVTHGPASLRLPYEKKLLANNLGMQPETLSRAQLKLQSIGVRYQKTLNAFVVRDIALLRDFANNGEDED